MHIVLTYALGLVLPLIGIVFISRRLEPARRQRARKFALIATAALASALGIGLACELNAGGVDSHQRGNWYSFDSGQPGAYRVPSGVIIPGAAQSPGCGGGTGQYPCPQPVYIPDRGAR